MTKEKSNRHMKTALYAAELIKKYGARRDLVALMNRQMILALGGDS